MMLRSKLKDFGEWLADLVGAEAAHYLFHTATHVAYGGFFAAQREELARYPVELFQAIASQQVAPNEEVDHFIERLWGLLLTVPAAPPNLKVRKPKPGAKQSAAAAARTKAFFEAPPEGTRLVNHQGATATRARDSR